MHNHPWEKWEKKFVILFMVNDGISVVFGCPIEFEFEKLPKTFEITFMSRVKRVL